MLQDVSEATDTDLIGWFKDFLDLFSRVDSNTIEEMNRRNPKMEKTWRDIFGVDAEIKAARADERTNITRTNLYTYVQEGGMSIDFAASEAHMTTDQFRQQMEEYTRTHRSQESLQTI